MNTISIGNVKYENGNLRYKGQFNNDIPIGIFYY